ncbi:hypothetical protein [uncultured Lacinutrix sp.]|uniref:hypothetical protein n=1 Tax=uncultured Lacinutrix sp. TaxID=574032 RepID=UPI002619AEB0|nr:hypothetical protein [uncultured Lacinutrix sp.]
MTRFPNKQKAIDLAIWQNHNHRFDDNYGVVLSSKGDYMVFQTDHPSFSKSEFENLPVDYKKMDYNHIQQIRMDADPLPHFEEIAGMFSLAHGETLRFILNTKIPLKRFIRYELACRGYDENFKWVGFDKAEEIWLK